MFGFSSSAHRLRINSFGNRVERFFDHGIKLSPEGEMRFYECDLRARAGNDSGLL